MIYTYVHDLISGVSSEENRYLQTDGYVKSIDKVSLLLAVKRKVSNRACIERSGLGLPQDPNCTEEPGPLTCMRLL